MATKKAAPKKKPATAVIVESVPAVHIEPADTSRADSKLAMRIDQLGGQVESIRAHYADASTDARFAAAVRLRSIAKILNDLTGDFTWGE